MDIQLSFVHSSTDSHFSGFCFLDIMNNAAVNSYGQDFVWAYVFIPLEYVRRSGISGSYGNLTLLTF